MSHYHGRLGSLEISVDAGANWVRIGGITEITLNGEKGEIGTTDHDDADFEAYIEGRKNFTIDGNLNVDFEDAGQVLLINNFYADGQAALWRFRPKGAGSSYPDRQASGFCNSHSEAAPNDDKAASDFKIRISGTLTKSVQPA